MGNNTISGVTKPTTEIIHTNHLGLEDLFPENDEFCPVCLTHQYWWINGQSWSPEGCSCGKNKGDAILWKNMTRTQKKVAARNMDTNWYVKYQVHYFSEQDRRAYE